MSNLLDRIAMAESGGNINAVSPTPLSSAQGLFGFTDAAFNQVKQDNPDLAHITQDEWKKSPDLQRTFAGRLQKFHEGVLKGQGFEPTPTNIYANWHFGSGGGPKFLKAAPDTPMESILDPMAIKANPHLQGKTQGQILEWINGKMGGGSMLPQATAQSRGQTNMNGNPQIDGAMALYQQLLGQQQNERPQMSSEQLQMLTQDRQQRASMLPLAIGASLAGDKRIASMGGAMYKDAIDAQGPMQLGQEGWVTPDGQMIANPYTQADRQERRQDTLLKLALSAAGRGKAPDPYFTPVMTPNGVGAFDNRSGKVNMVNGDDGKPIIDARLDPTTQGNIVGAKEGAKITAQRTTTEQLDAPKMIEDGNNTIKLVDDLLAAPGFSQAVGKSRMFGIQMIPGTDAKDFDIRLDQLKGKQFLEAFQSLKGGGQITEVEGKKATDAIARMNASGSEEEFKKAAREFQDILKLGVDRAKRSGGGQVQQPQAPRQSNSAAPSVDDILNQYR